MVVGHYGVLHTYLFHNVGLRSRGDEVIAFRSRNEIKRFATMGGTGRPMAVPKF